MPNCALRILALRNRFLAVICVFMGKNTPTRPFFPQKKGRNRPAGRNQICRQEPSALKD